MQFAIIPLFKTCLNWYLDLVSNYFPSHSRVLFEHFNIEAENTVTVISRICARVDVLFENVYIHPVRVYQFDWIYSYFFVGEM